MNYKKYINALKDSLSIVMKINLELIFKINQLSHQLKIANSQIKKLNTK